MKFVEGEDKLSKKCKPCVSIRQGKVLGARLLEILLDENGAVGLAANQVGVDAAVCVINVVSQVVVINPRITAKFGKSFFHEACLSFTGGCLLTAIWKHIIVVAYDHVLGWSFSFNKIALQDVCGMHALVQLNGITTIKIPSHEQGVNGRIQ